MSVTIDLTREEGARVLERELFLYPQAERIANKFLSNIESFRKVENIEETFSSNYFIDGKRGTGKTSVLLTVKEILKRKDVDDKKLETLELINLSVNYSGLLSHVLSHIESELESNEGSIHQSNMWNLLSEIKLGFPNFLKCSFEESLRKICGQEIEEIFNNLEIKFLVNLRKLISEYHRNFDKEIVLFIDDIDLVPDKLFLYRAFLEMAIFLSVDHIHIIAAGDLDNAFRIFKSAIRENIVGSNSGDDERHIVLSFIDKVFPVNNRIKLELLSELQLREVKLKVELSKENKTLSLKEFLEEHPTFKSLSQEDEDVVYLIFEELPIREFVQVLRDVKDKISIIKEKKEIAPWDLSISNVLSKLSFKEYYTLLKLPTGGNLKLKREGNLFQLIIKNKEVDFKNLSNYNEKLGEIFFKSFYEFYKFNEQEFIKAFKIENQQDIVKLIPLFSFIKIVDRRFYSLLLIWLKEVMNYVYGSLFFLPYCLVLYTFLYGVPNYFLKLEDKIGKGKDKLFNPIDKIELLLKQSNVKELIFYLESLDLILGLDKHFSVKENIAKNFIMFHNIIYNKVVPHFYKFWFLSHIVSKYKLDSFVEEPFYTYSEEDDDSKKNFLEKEDLKKFIEKFNKELLGLIPEKHRGLNILDFDKNIFSFLKTISHILFKEAEKKIISAYAFYYIFSLSLYLISLDIKIDKHLIMGLLKFISKGKGSRYLKVKNKDDNKLEIQIQTDKITGIEDSLLLTTFLVLTLSYITTRRKKHIEFINAKDFLKETAKAKCSKLKGLLKLCFYSTCEGLEEGDLS